MPVDSQHPTFTKNLPLWCKCRVTVDGEDAVKAAGEEYLPKLSDQEKGEYNSYKNRASFYGATRRTVQGLAGAVMRKRSELKFPDAEKDMLTSIGVAGQSLEIMIKDSLEEVLTTSRVGLLVDAPGVEDGDTIAAGENPEPYVALYYAEHVINWQTIMINGKRELSLVVLKEESLRLDPKDSDHYKADPFTQYRVLRLNLLDKATASYEYSMETWEYRAEEGSGQKKWIRTSNVIPTKWGGKSWERIPFLFDTPSGVTDKVENPPILDMVNLNLSLYRNSADLEHGLHFTALPTAWVAGFDLKTTKLKIGAQNAWSTENESAKAGYLEFTGVGLGSIREQMKEKKQELAVLGGRLLEEQKQEAEAAAAISLRQAGDQSVLSNVAKSVSEAWTQVLRWCAEWMALTVKPEDISISLSQDFAVASIDGHLLTALIAACQGGLMSWDSLFYNFKRSEMVPDNVTAEDERARIEAGVPAAPPTPQQQADHELKLKQMEAQANLDKQVQQPPKTPPVAA
jgi:hypothetical protein